MVCLAYFFDMLSILFNQALPDVRLTGVGIKCLYCTYIYSPRLAVSVEEMEGYPEHWERHDTPRQSLCEWGVLSSKYGLQRRVLNGLQCNCHLQLKRSSKPISYSWSTLLNTVWSGNGVTWRNVFLNFKLQQGFFFYHSHRLQEISLTNNIKVVQLSIDMV